MVKDLPLIPRAIIFGNPDHTNPLVSPDGKHIAYLAPWEGVVNVWVRSIDNEVDGSPVTFSKTRPIRNFFWSYTNAHILYLKDNAGDENFHLYLAEIKSGNAVDLTPGEKVQAKLVRINPHFPEEIMVAVNDRVPQLHDVYRINTLTGNRALVYQNQEGYIFFVADEQQKVRLARKMLQDGSAELVEYFPETGWKTFLKIPAEDTLSTQPVELSKDGQYFYLVDSIGRDTSAMVMVNLITHESTLIANHPKADVCDQIIHPTSGKLQAVAFNYLRKKWVVIDEDIRGDLQYLQGVRDGDIKILSRSLDDRLWTVEYEVDNGPIRFYLYDRTQRKVNYLFSNRKGLEEFTLAKMRPEVIPSRDGLDLVCYYSLPAQYNGDAIPDRPLPMLLWIHGGPWARDNWEYNSIHQIFTNRGYAVMSINYRGSTGFGKQFLNAGNLEWGGKMHTDLVDAVNWSIEAKIADPKKIAISGGSYGGFATLSGLTQTPDVFCCGVDLVGPSNLVTMIESFPSYWAPLIEVFTKRMGDHRTPEGRTMLMERSPLTHVDAIKKPLLIGQGANDPRVKQAESDQIVAAMEAKHIPVTYLLYGDEGHGFSRPENNLSFIAVMEAFLSAVMGGRKEPFGSAFKGANFKVITGGQFIPGLEE